MEEVIIIGSGPAGLTAAIYCARAGAKPLVLSGPNPGGQLIQTTEVENFPGFEEPILGFDLIARMRAQAEKCGTRFVDASLTGVKLNPESGHVLQSTDGVERVCKSLIIAVGAQAKRLGLPDEENLWGHGVSACATCDGPFFRGETVAVVGGGDTAMEESLLLTKFAGEVHLIHRRDAFRASKIMQDRVLAQKKIVVHWNSAVSALLGETELTGVRLKDVKTGAETELACRACFAAIGHKPATEVFQGQMDMDANGYVKVSPGTTRTSVARVFACGDCMDPEYRQAVTAAGTGCMAALEMLRTE